MTRPTPATRTAQTALAQTPATPGVRTTPAIRELASAIGSADAIVVGAGSGLSTAAGFTYAGPRFEALFGDFIAAHGLTDMYTAGFYPFETPEEQWAYWSRHIWHNRYVPAPRDTYRKLRELLQGTDFFVITTNVDHQFQRAGFPKERLFYTQGDYGLWQCSVPCHQQTYDNQATVKAMVEQQRDRRIPGDLVPRCPRCGAPMAMNLRSDQTFVEDGGWHRAAERYADFLRRREHGRVLYWELGVGANTPGIIKYPFWSMVRSNPEATYATVNLGEAWAPLDIRKRSLVVDGDIDAVLGELVELRQHAQGQPVPTGVTA